MLSTQLNPISVPLSVKKARTICFDGASSDFMNILVYLFFY